MHDPTYVRHLEQATETESGRAITRNWREGSRELVFNGSRVSVWDDDKVWKRVVVIGAQYCE